MVVMTKFKIGVVTMRMWMVDPKKMCRQHLLGEHNECHMLFGSLKKDISLQGYIDNGLVEIDQIPSRHEELAEEMLRRGYKHNTPIVGWISPIRQGANLGYVDIEANEKELSKRCKSCRKLLEEK